MKGEVSFWYWIKSVYGECRGRMGRGVFVSAWRTLRYVVLGDTGKVRLSPATSQFFRARHAEWWSFQNLTPSKDP